ncbi:MAG: glutathione S-transferase family protein [Methylobacteriaceae bacterium]|nr:glutathione S-transferase family protein [Methylobacteriaceae bacterium]
MMKLYWAPGTRSLRTLWMLEEAGAPYERVLVDIRNGGQNDPAFRRINPMGKVPAFEDGAAQLAESAAICAYIAERCPEAGLAPQIGDPLRGRYFHWLFFAPGCIEPAFTQKFTKIELPTTAAGWGDFSRVFDALEGALQKGPWILGERFSAADVMIGCDLLFGVERFKIVEPRPVFAAYLERCHARPALQRALAIDAAG